MQKSYTKIWHYGTYIMIGILCVLPLGFTYPMIAHPAYVEYNPLSDTYVARTHADLSFLYSALIVWMIVTIILSVFVNTLCWYRISKYSQQTRQQSEYRLFLVSFVTFLFQIAAFSIGTINKISADVDPSKLLLISRIGQVLSPFANDLLTLTTPYVLIIFSKRMVSKVLFVALFIAVSCALAAENSASTSGATSTGTAAPATGAASSAQPNPTVSNGTSTSALPTDNSTVSVDVSTTTVATTTKSTHTTTVLLSMVPIAISMLI
ncbi:hypothetical protein GCK72_018018 [Caenorhabditis remanei]|uniref:Serpentine receptor class gamma n=1 Tax=Caenorhabditis remanei TaxID=31234 RepID=A0A6A5G9Y8_CAERE|nr:hypothetical protein GCK72_018018 [Caenorhabditis remanei]KAF1751464.1 hypothetical protein GCK72_018018 [Caenorhabditis remanei]